MSVWGYRLVWQGSFQDMNRIMAVNGSPISKEVLQELVRFYEHWMSVVSTQFLTTANVSQTSTLGRKDSSPVGIHPWKLTWNLKRMVSKRNFLFQGSIFNFHVSFRGSIQKHWYFVLIHMESTGTTGMHTATYQGRVPSCCDLVSGGVEQYLGLQHEGCPLWLSSFKELLEGHYHVVNILKF